LTDWDLASYIQAILAAEKLGILHREGDWGSVNRVERILRFLETRPITDNRLSYVQYDAETGQVPEDMKKSTVDPSHWGKLLLALDDLRRVRRDLETRINHIVARYDTKLLAESGYFASPDMYPFYVAQGYWAFGYPTPKLTDLANLGEGSTIEVHGLSLPRARITSDPLVLATLEDRTNQIYRICTNRIYEAQKRRSDQTGILTAYGEGVYPNPPYYAYEWVITADGEQWIVQVGEEVKNLEMLYTKIAFAFHAIYSDDYTKKLLEKVADLASNRGFYEGITSHGSRIRVLSDKTNSMILEAAAYVLLKTWGNSLDWNRKASYQNAQSKAFPRYAITGFVVSSKDAKRAVELLRSTGAYNVTLIYRGGPTLLAERDELLKICEGFKEFRGMMIPELSFMQTLPPTRRSRIVIDRWNLFKSVVGEYPAGLFAFQLDTYTLNYVKDSHKVEFAIGNVWDQVNMDFISSRGAYSFPYYASRRNAMVPARSIEDASVLVMQPFAISLTNVYHYNNNHLVDLLTHGGNTDEFKYLSLNYPFFIPFFLELDWLLALDDQHMTQAFVEVYSWVFKNFEVVTPLAFAEIFGRSFPTTPEYHVFFKASNNPAFPNTAGLTIEWLMNPDVRIARVDGRVISALRYKQQTFDAFLATSKTIDFDGSRFGEDPTNIINLDLAFDIDALWQYEYGRRTLKDTSGATFDGDLHDFYGSKAVANLLQDCHQETTGAWSALHVFSDESVAVNEHFGLMLGRRPRSLEGLYLKRSSCGLPSQARVHGTT